jgi:hypothetical protein
MEKLFNLFERLVLAVEKIAGGAPPASVPTAEPTPDPVPAKPGRGRPRKETPPPPAPAPAAASEDDDNPFGDDEGAEPEDDTPAPTKVTKEQVNEKMFAYNKLAGGAKTKELLAKSTSNAADRPSQVLPADYVKVYTAFDKAIKAHEAA